MTHVTRAVAEGAASTRKESDVRRERFITRQMKALRDLGLPPEALAREESLLRGGQRTAQIISEIFTVGISRL